MRTLSYLALDVITHTLAVSLVLFIVVFSGRFIKYLAEAAIGDLSAGILLPVMLYKLPAFFELILPLGFYIGLLLSFGRLYADSEMVIFMPGKLTNSRVKLAPLPIVAPTLSDCFAFAVEMPSTATVNLENVGPGFGVPKVAV